MADVSPPTIIRIASTSGRLRIDAEPQAEVSVSKGAEMTRTGDTVTIDAGFAAVDVVVPEGVDLVVGSDSGRIEVRGRLGAVAISTGSGRIDLSHARSADVRTESGRIFIGRVDSECRAHSTNARIEVEHCGTADVSSDSGRVAIGEVDGPAVAHSVSGRISIGVLRAADIEAETVSGRIEVAFPAGVSFYRASAGSPKQRPAGSDCTVLARSGSGSVSVTSQ